MEKVVPASLQRSDAGSGCIAAVILAFLLLVVRILNFLMTLVEIVAF